MHTWIETFLLGLARIEDENIGLSYEAKHAELTTYASEELFLFRSKVALPAVSEDGCRLRFGRFTISW